MFRIVEDSMPPLPKECSELLENFLEQCFHKDPTKRPSAEELCEHPWLKNNWVALKVRSSAYKLDVSLCMIDTGSFRTFGLRTAFRSSDALVRIFNKSPMRCDTSPNLTYPKLQSLPLPRMLVKSHRLVVGLQHLQFDLMGISLLVNTPS